MTDYEIRKRAASLNGRRSWEARKKKWGSKAAVSAKMRLIRQGKKVGDKSR
jgi:hypothetical protein